MLCRYLRLALGLIVLLTLPTSAIALTAEIPGGEDNTLIEDPDGALSNGAGPAVFAGRTNQAENSRRRPVLWFDVTGNLPPDAIIEDVVLILYLEKGNGGPREMKLYRLLADWGEGDSLSEGGSGAPATRGDATWVHRFYPSVPWGRDGGRYSGRVSAVQSVGDLADFYTWSGERMAQDVGRWLRDPAMNFGWILLGDETAAQTVKRFASRDNPDAMLRPLLEIRYRFPE